MIKVSRRSAASYGADQLLAGKPAGLVAKQLASLLIESGRTQELELLLGDIAWELEHRRALTIGKVTTANPLKPELAAALKTQLQTATKSSEVMLEEQLDKSVLGGIRVETSGRVWDSTISRKLSELREAF